MKKTTKTDSERRAFRRRPLLETFSFFISLPQKGSYRLTAHDISEQGMGFDFDIAGEDLGGHAVQPGDLIEVHLYLNQSLSIPLMLRVIRVQVESLKRRVGAEFQPKASPGYKAFLSFLQFVDDLHELQIGTTQ